MKKALITFNEKAAIQSEIKPFKLIEDERGKRVWISENGLILEAVKIGNKVYYEASIVKGESLGGINRMGEKIDAKKVQFALSEFASKYNFHFIKKQVKLIRESEVGRQLFFDWQKLRKTLTTN